MQPLLKKVTPSYPATPFLKLRSCQAFAPRPFSKIWLEAQPLSPPSRKGGADYANKISLHKKKGIDEHNDSFSFSSVQYTYSY